MKLIFIFGPHAVGKMTVGQELTKITGLKLFHNHMTIELIAPFFGFGSNSPVGSKLVFLFRKKIFEEFVKTDQEGLIFTYVWDFDSKKDWRFIHKISHTFASKGAEIFFIELETDLEERLKRNITPNRLDHKPSKRDVIRSEKNLKDAMEKHRLNSHEGEIKEKNYMKINNSNLSAEEVAKFIKKRFRL